MLDKFAFLKSVRFWKLGTIAIIVFLNANGIIPSEVAVPVIAWLTGDIVINTIDRFSK